MRATLNSRAGIPLRYANRHGLITGATGTGKSVTLLRLAEQFASHGVPVFLADVKGDIAALARSTTADLLDPFGSGAGRPIRIAFDAMGAALTARALDLTDAQSGCVEIAFAFARDHGAPLATLADMRRVLGALLADPRGVAAAYGQAGQASVAVVNRALLRLESQGAGQVFGAPSFDVADLLTPGRASILSAVRLVDSPRVYAALLTHILAELWSRMPEIGDSDKPRLVLFFDESHLLFDGAPAALLQRLEQTARLIRSKGIGVYFATQSPDDVPTQIRAQLAHTIAHDRALPIGTARVRTMSDDGRPLPETLERIDLPRCPLGTLDDSERPAVPLASTANAPGQFDVYGYAFLAIVAAALAGAIWAAVGLWQAGLAGSAVAVVTGAALALRTR